MRRWLMCVALLSTLVPAVAEDKLPYDVQRFVDRREGCDHFRGEEAAPGDEQRRREVDRALRKLCTGTDRELAQLKKKYKANSAVMRRLNEFEDRIE